MLFPVSFVSDTPLRYIRRAVGFGGPTQSVWHRGPVRAWCVGQGSRQHLEQGGLELVHLLLGADGDANMRRPARPDAADVNLFPAEGIDYLLSGSIDVEHELVRHRGNISEIVFIEKSKNVGTHFADEP